MRADSFEVVLRAVNWVGGEIDARQTAQLDSYHQWLVEEAAVAGGIGPQEVDKLWNRHIADSLVFGSEIRTGTRCLDIGSGVGLPGIPLAIVYPATSFVLLDRSGRRCDLMNRAISILGLDNCVVLHRDIVGLQKKFDTVVSRAAIPPAKMMIHVKRLLEPGGVAVLGLSRSDTTRDTLSDTHGLATSVITIPFDILDTDAKLLRIEAT